MVNDAATDRYSTAQLRRRAIKGTRKRQANDSVGTALTRRLPHTAFS